MKAIIIEDEEPARQLLKTYLQSHTEIELIKECADGFSGVKAINELKPDLVFLDIQMPRLTGIEVIELIEHKPAIVFTTAYDNYAIQAFEANAIDYLLKPFSKERFDAALLKAKQSIAAKHTEQQVSGLITTYEQTNNEIDRIAVKEGSQIHIIANDEIIYIAAEGDYVMLHTASKSFLKEKTMKYFETHLPSKKFVRIHRSSIVNVTCIKKIDHYDKENYSAVLTNGTVLKISTAGYKLLKDVINL